MAFAEGGAVGIESVTRPSGVMTPLTASEKLLLTRLKLQPANAVLLRVTVASYTLHVCGPPCTAWCVMTPLGSMSVVTRNPHVSMSSSDKPNSVHVPLMSKLSADLVNALPLPSEAGT